MSESSATTAQPATPGPAIPIRVNGESRAVPDGCNVEELLSLIGIEGRRVAVAVNASIVPRSAFGFHLLEAGDHVEILEAVGGG